MNADLWVQVKQVFAELADSDSAVREARLHQLDEPVRRELEWLLANHDEATEYTGILDKPALDSPAILQWLGAAQVFAPGQVLLDRFEIIRLIGRGGMGEVYEAVDQQHPQLIAIKTIRLELLSDSGIRGRFRTEVQRSRQVSHENVCRVHELFSGSFNDEWHVPFFTMELLRGETLQERVRRDGSLSPWEARNVAHQICAGLDAAHRCGVVHRDLKSGNIILVPNGDGQLRAKITDFGLAREVPPDHESFITTTLTDGAGTLAYMAPELLEGRNADTASDIYALGVVLYRMVTARYPRELGADVLSAVMRLKNPPPSPRTYVADLSRAWERTILACLALDPELRPASAHQVAELLRDVPAARWSYRRRVLARQLERRAFLLGGGAVAAAAVGGLLLRNDAPPFDGRQISVLVEDFESFDPGGALGRAVRNMVRIAFSRSDSVRIVRPDVVLEASKALNVGAVAIRGETAQRLARHTKADVVIRGSLQRSDAEFRLQLIALRSDDATELLKIEAAAADQQQLAPVVERAADNLQVGLTGGSLAAFQTRLPRVEPADTLRADALEMFTAGLEYFEYGDHSTAVTYFEQANKLDPNFAMAYMYQAISHSSLRRGDLAFPLLSRAYGLRNRVNDRQRLHLVAVYHDRCGDLSTALDQHRALIAMYPNDANLHGHIAHLYARMDRVVEMEQHARAAIELDPRSALNYMLLASGLAQSEKIEDALHVLARGRQQCGDSPLFLASEGVVKLISGDVAAALAAFQSLGRVPGYAAHSRWQIAGCLLAYGPLGEARARLETDAAVNQVARESQFADVARYHLASVLNLEGDSERAAELALLLASRTPEPYHLVALTNAAELAWESRSPTALTMAVDKIRRLCDRYPSVRLNGFLLRARALQSELAGRTSEGQQMLQQAQEMWRDIAGTWALAGMYKRRGEFSRALGLYESIVERRGSALRFDNQIHLVRSYAESARCYRALGNTGQALERYDEFLRHWGRETNLDLVRQIRAERELTFSKA